MSAHARRFSGWLALLLGALLWVGLPAAASARGGHGTTGITSTTRSTTPSTMAIIAVATGTDGPAITAPPRGIGATGSSITMAATTTPLPCG